MTEEFFQLFSQWRDEARKEWIAQSWEGGFCDPNALTRLRAQDDLLMQLEEFDANDAYGEIRAPATTE